MSGLQQYAVGAVYVNGALLTEAASIKVSRKTNAQNVMTLNKGFGGQSPGARIVEISVSNAVPSADFELNPGAFMEGLRVVEFTVFAAGRALTVKGMITEDNFDSAVNSEAKLEFSATCEWGDWK